MTKSAAQLLIFTFLLLTSAIVSAEPTACEQAIIRNVYEAVHASRVKRQGTRLPRFNNPSEEIEISHEWKPELGPKLLQEMLPENIGFANHEQETNVEPGVVNKSEAGVFTHLRYDDIRDGHNFGTSVGVVDAALSQNLGKKQKYLVRRDAKAAVIWIHGGGTRTTGYQTGANNTILFNNYGIDTISLSMPWHEEGPRAYFANENEFFDWLNDFINKYVPNDIPVVLMGHSMGGLFTDMANRRTDDPSFKLGQRVDGYVAMAPVADLAPGQSARDKFTAQASFEQSQNTENIASSDQAIFTGMVRENKLSPIAMTFVYLMELFHDWSLPEHNGDNYKPMLVLVGENDGLTYVGYEEAFQNYMSPLSNVDFKVIKDHEGNKDAGHVTMLEITRPGSTKFEYLEYVLEYLERITGEKIEAIDKSAKNASNVDFVLTKLARLWANNLAFREFAQNFVLQKKSPEAGLDEITKADSKNKAFTGQYYKIANNKNLSEDEKKQQIAELAEKSGVEHIDEAIALNQKLMAIRKSEYVPAEADNVAEIQANVDERQALDRKLGQLSARKKQLLSEKQNLETSYRQKQKQVASAVEALSPDVSDKYAALLQKESQKLDELVALDLEVRRAIEAYLLQLAETDQLQVENQQNLPDDLLNLISQYEAKAKAYQDLIASTQTEIYQLALQGELGDSVKSLVVELFGVSPDFATQHFAGDSLMGQILSHLAQLHSLEVEVEDGLNKKNELLATYVNELVPGYFSIKAESLADVLNGDRANAQAMSAVLQNALSKWDDMWKARASAEFLEVLLQKNL